MAGRETIYAVAVAIVTVFFSVAAHGISAAPLANWYGERQDALRWQAIAEEFPMTIIAGYTFDTAEGAGQLLDLIRDLSRQGLISVEDAALATWPEGKKQCTIKILGDLTGPGALNRTCWGLLFGLVSHFPGLGAAIGALVGLLSPNAGVDREFIKTAQEKLTEGASALFLVTSSAEQDKVTEAVDKCGLNFDPIYTTMSWEQEQQLREDLAA